MMTSDLQTAPTSSAPLLYSVRDASKALGIGKSSLWNLIKDGHLKTTKIGTRTLVRADSLRLLAETGA